MAEAVKELNKAEESKFNSNNNAIVFNTYGCEILSRFNKKHKTKFSCVFGVTDNMTATSTLDKARHNIAVNIPKSLMDTTDANKIEATKILIGHELAHHIYVNMTMKAFSTFAMCVNAVAGKFRQVIGSCSIESAADIAGERFYREICGNVSDDVYKAYRDILEGGQPETPAKMKGYISLGYLPPSYRIRIMKKYKSFSANNYEILTQICSDIDFIGTKYMEKDLRSRKWISWMQDQFELMNFPNRPNRIR